MERYYFKTGLFVAAIALLSACGNKAAEYESASEYDVVVEPVENEVADSSETNQEETRAFLKALLTSEKEDDFVAIPCKDNGNGTYSVALTMNGTLAVNAMLDTGASWSSISSSEVRFLYEKGVLKEDDLVGTMPVTYANGETKEVPVITLHDCYMGPISLGDIVAVVQEDGKSDVLLGQEVLRRFKSYTIDNEEGVLKLSLE